MIHIVLTIVQIFGSGYFIKCSPIVNGVYRPREPLPGDYPYHANIMDKLSQFSICGGSLLHPYWVLTAGHCFQRDDTQTFYKPFELIVGLGSIYTDCRGGQLLDTHKLILHPNFAHINRNDIGLIKLQRPARLGPYVNIVTLHTNNLESLIGKTALLTGFGVINDRNDLPRRLRKAVLHIVNSTSCYEKSLSSNLELCAASSLSEGKACRGDSGGPLVLYRNKKYYQIGLTSHLALLPICKLKFNNSVHTRISAYISWISSVTGINFMTRKRQNR